MYVDADALEQTKVATNPREETRPIASEATSMETTQKLDLKFLVTIITIIGGIITIIGGVIAIINSSNDRVDRLETTMNMRINRLEDNLSMRIVESENRTNKSISETTRGIERLEDVLIGRSEKQFSLDGSVRGDVESPLT